MKFYLFFFFYLSLGALSAQNIVFSGSVVNENGNPISLVNVFSKASSNGGFTDTNGDFTILLSKKKQTVVLSHVGYKSIQYVIDAKSIEGDSLYQYFVMEKEVETMAELELKGGEIQRAYNQAHIRILDFDFYEDGFIMLIVEEDEYKLRWIGPNEELIYDILLSKHPKDLYKDCHNNFFVVYRASVAQVFVNEEKRWLEKTCSMADFNKKIKACVAAADNYIYIREYGLHNQGVRYYKWDEKKQDISLFSAVFDKYGYANAAGEMAYINRLGGLNNPNVSLNTRRKIEASYGFYKNILAKPEYQPLFKLKDELLLCNHIADSIYVYHFDGSLKRSFPINYHQQKGWKELIVDAAGTSLFARCTRDGMAYILEIDTKTGVVIGSHQLKEHVFPSTIRIKDHIAYYLHKDNGYFTETNIYQQSLR